MSKLLTVLLRQGRFADATFTLYDDNAVALSEGVKCREGVFSAEEGGGLERCQWR